MTEDVHHIGAQLKLLCPVRHHIGHLMQLAPAPSVIEYWPRDGSKEPWPPRDEWGPSTWWIVPCPDGCRGQFGGPVDIISGAVLDLNNDRDRDEGEYTLIRAGA